MGEPSESWAAERLRGNLINGQRECAGGEREKRWRNGRMNEWTALLG